MGCKINKAVILDRDGVINEDGNYIYRPEDFHFSAGIFEFCRAAQEKGYLLIVATNQSGIARGYYSDEDFQCLSEWMLKEFKKNGVTISAVYYCPFHPEKGIGTYKIDSEDRKPKPGMFLKAASDFDLDLSQSMTIGDKDSDMAAGRAAGVGRLLLLPGKYEFTNSEDVTYINTLIEAKSLL